MILFHFLFLPHPSPASLSNGSPRHTPPGRYNDAASLNTIVMPDEVLVCGIGQLVTLLTCFSVTLCPGQHQEQLCYWCNGSKESPGSTTVFSEGEVGWNVRAEHSWWVNNSSHLKLSYICETYWGSRGPARALRQGGCFVYFCGVFCAVVYLLSPKPNLLLNL